MPKKSPNNRDYIDTKEFIRLMQENSEGSYFVYELEEMFHLFKYTLRQQLSYDRRIYLMDVGNFQLQDRHPNSCRTFTATAAKPRRTKMVKFTPAAGLKNYIKEITWDEPMDEVQE